MFSGTLLKIQSTYIYISDDKTTQENNTFW